MPSSPLEYAQRYLEVPVPTANGTLTIRVDRYHLGDPTPAKDDVWTPLKNLFLGAAGKKQTPTIDLTVNGEPVVIRSHTEILMNVVRPFSGKGSPEDCQIALQLALFFKVITPEGLQDWADKNIGTDCNGFVGNYLFHEFLGNTWDVNDTRKDPGSSAWVSSYFEWANHNKERDIADVKTINSCRLYLIGRVDGSGNVIPRVSGSAIAHVGITQPATWRNLLFMLSDARDDLRTMNAPPKATCKLVESSGAAVGGQAGMGVQSHWLDIEPHPKLKGVFNVRRDGGRLDPVKIVAVPGS